MAFGVPNIAPTMAGIPGVMPTGIPGLMPTGIPGALPTGIPGMVPTAIPGLLPTAAPGMVPTVVPTAGCALVYGPVANVCNAASAVTHLIPSTTVMPVPNTIAPATSYGAPIPAAAGVPVMPTAALPVGKPAVPFGKPAMPFGKPAMPFAGGAPVAGGVPIPAMSVSPLGVGIGLDGLAAI